MYVNQLVVKKLLRRPDKRPQRDGFGLREVLCLTLCLTERQRHEMKSRDNNEVVGVINDVGIVLRTNHPKQLDVIENCCGFYQSEDDRKSGVQ